MIEISKYGKREKLSRVREGNLRANLAVPFSPLSSVCGRANNTES